MIMNKTVLKNIAIYAALVAVMLVMSYAYVPAVLSGKIVNQSDISGWKGMAQETIEWNNAHPGDKTRWSDSMFGGMPNVTTVDDFDGDWTKPLYKALLWGKRPASYLFVALLGAFLMMLAMGVNRYLSLVGAIAVAFCAYNFQIIQVGHNTKMQAIAFAPWAIAAMIFTYRAALGELCSIGKQCLTSGVAGSTGGKWLPLSVLGSALFALALSFQIKANHVQITYYLAIIIVIYAVATFIWVLLQQNKKQLLGRFAAASALLLVLGIMGIATNANKLIPTYEYAPFTMRGGSELSGAGANSKGLDLDYATAWSYGIEETPNLMIANYNGGASSGSLGEKSATWQLFKKAGQNPRQICKSLPLYWGPQPFTAGPMYMGAITIFLFILGMCLLKGRERWWALACAVLAILLAWGSHFMWFTELWFKYAPMYNKFRTVSMALVILQFCLPLVGIVTLDRILRQQMQPRKVVKAVWISMGVTAGFCALVSLIPGIAGSFESPADSQMHEMIAEALQADRKHLLRVDALRSFILIVCAAAFIVWSYLKPDHAVQRKRLYITGAVVGVLVLADMWSMGKRYLNDSHFVKAKDFNAQFDERPVDEMILEDTALSYRVLDLSESTFNSSLTSFRHKSIGGYSPTKMQRYQDLIDRYISKEISSAYSALQSVSTISEAEEKLPYLSVVSMLNGKYIIIGGEYAPLENRQAFGPAWFVSETATASSADEEIELMGKVDLRSCAVVRANHVPSGTAGVEAVPSSEEAVAVSTVEMTSYAPNELHYEYEAAEPSMIVFSEIYHPYWEATLNGEPLDLLRADWVLRAANVPAGKGEIVMRYNPKDCILGERLSRASSILLLLLVLGSIAFACSTRYYPKM